MARIINSNEQQLLFYDRGVGTDNFIDKISGGAFGHGLFENVEGIILPFSYWPPKLPVTSLNAVP
jgi:uncharacterized protein (DUF2235 family)